MDCTLQSPVRVRKRVEMRGIWGYVWDLRAGKREGATLKEKGIRMPKRSEEMVLLQWVFRLLGLLDYENRQTSWAWSTPESSKQMVLFFIKHLV